VKKLHNIVSKIFHPQQTPTGPENMQTKPAEGCTDHSANSAKEPISSTVADLGNKVKANKKTISFIDTTPLGPKVHTASINKSKPEGSDNIRATRASKGNGKGKLKIMKSNIQFCRSLPGQSSIASENKPLRQHTNNRKRPTKYMRNSVIHENDLQSETEKESSEDAEKTFRSAYY
jgi:hypothetical protein